MKMFNILNITIRVLTLITQRLMRLNMGSSMAKGSDSPGQNTEGRDSRSDVAIILTTHSRRFFSSALPLISAIRESANPNWPVIVVINADTFQNFDFDTRTEFLKRLSEMRAVFPICLGEPAGMSELWNTGIRLGGASVNLVLSDDLAFADAALPELLGDLADKTRENDLVVLNHSWGHFGITRRAVDECGWFDECLLGFGEEDGDYAFRFSQSFGRQPYILVRPGLSNMSSSEGFEEIVKGKGKYSLFNKVFIELKYSEDANSRDTSMIGKVRQEFNSPNPYPISPYKKRMSHLLLSSSEDEIRNELKGWLRSQN